jgi:hypothetical protein
MPDNRYNTPTGSEDVQVRRHAHFRGSFILPSVPLSPGGAGYDEGDLLW